MQDIYKNPILYYILVPVMIGLWPLWLRAIGNPSAKNNFHKETQQYKDAEKKIAEILKLDPPRLDYARAQKQADKFDYDTAIAQTVKQCSLSRDYKLSSGKTRKTREQVSQDATLSLDKIEIEKFAKFLSMLQMRWPNLQCTHLKLTKKKNAKDLWKIDLRLQYYQ